MPAEDPFLGLTSVFSRSVVLGGGTSEAGTCLTLTSSWPQPAGSMVKTARISARRGEERNDINEASLGSARLSKLARHRLGLRGGAPRNDPGAPHLTGP